MYPRRLVPDSLCLHEEEYDELPSLRSHILLYLKVLGVTRSEVTGYAILSENLVFEGKVIGAVSFWYSDHDGEPTSRLEMARSFFAKRRAEFEKACFCNFATECIADAQGWLHSGKKLSSREKRNIVRAAQMRINDFFTQS